jgi:heme A synthase
LRAIHPLIACATTVVIAVACGLLRALRPGRAVLRLASGASALALGQVAAGVLNLVLRAPVALQLVHLVLADAVWIALVLAGAAALAAQSPSYSQRDSHVS